MTGMGKRNPARDVQTWNATVLIGTPVVVRRDDGERMHTKTRSEAWVLGGHTAVVMVDGIAGGYLLDRVMPRRDEREGGDG